MKTACPHCDAEFEVQPQWVGTPMTCPFCRESMTVAADSAGEPAAALTDFLEHDATERSSSKSKTCPMCGAENPIKAGECHACGEPLTPFSLSTQGRVFRDGKRLVMTKDAVLPYRCLKTNDDADSLLRRKLYWHQPWVYIFIISPLIYIIVALIARQTADIKIPLCRAIRRRRRWAILVAWIFGLGMFAMLPMGIAFGEANRMPDLGPLLGMGGFFAGLIGLIVSLQYVNIATPAKINRTHVWLNGVHPEYLAALPEWEDE